MFSVELNYQQAKLLKRLAFAIICCFVALHGRPVHAKGLWETALEKLGEFVDERAEQKRLNALDDPLHKATIPGDLPKYWRLSVFKESVLGGELVVA